MDAEIPPYTHRKLRPAPGGFSLVEICLALGIVAFALVPLVGLLAVGLDSYHNANLRGRGAQVVSKIASAIRQSSATTSGDYAAAAPFAAGLGAITWTPNTATTAHTIYFDENGEVTSSTSTGTGWNPPQMVAMVVVSPPSTKFDPGKAVIAVAWPAVKPPVYTPGSGTAGTISFSNPQGHNESTISFIINSP